MLVTPLPIVTLVKLLQPLNAQSEIVVTPAGMTILAIDTLLNAPPRWWSSLRAS